MAADSAQKFHGLAGKTAVITGGASGIGEAYVRALVDAGVHVCFGDKDIAAGARLASELPTTRFVSCDVSKWEDQVYLFEEAVKFSPSEKVHYVVANAGIAPKDEVFAFEGPEGPPKKPDLKTIDVNLAGGLYTVKLAMHYFIKQNGIEKRLDQEDTCLVLIGSGAAFLDIPRGPSYPATKWALRGVMHSLRRTAFYYGSRVNMISPWYVRTGILSRDQFDQVEKSGVALAEAPDAARALLHILQDNAVNGRSFFIAPKKWAPQGYIDLDIDDYSGNNLLQEIQAEQIAPAPVELGLFRFIDNGYVYVRDGITEEVKGGSFPDRIQLDAPIRSYSGYSVIPGLIDSHIHALSGNLASIEQSLRLYADFKCAGLGALIPGGWPIPVIKEEFSHSGKSDSDLAECTASWPSLSALEDAARFVKHQIQQNGASCIKMFHEVGDTVGMDLPLPSLDLQKAVVDAAHQLGVVAIGHALSYQGAMVLLRAGVDGLTHIFCDEPPSNDYIALMKETGAHCNPTLGLVASQTDEGRELFEWFRKNPLAEQVLMSRATYRPHGLASSQKPKSSIEHARANTRALYKAGVPILAGTDASGTGVGLPYGLGLHMELYALIHYAGLSIADALRSATSIPADRFKFHDRGRIEKGKNADLVLVKTDVAEFLEDRQNRLMPLAAVFRNSTVAAPYERFWNWGTRK